MRNALKLAGTALVLLLAAFVTVELLVRIFAPQERPLFIADPLIRTIHKPNVDTMRKGPEYQAHIHTNAQGFIGKDFSIEKPPGTYRIAALGDSFTEALDVDVDKSYTALLEGMLTESHKTPYQIYNFGISGAGSTHELLTYTKYAAAYNPDMVLWQVYLGNDLADDLLLRADGMGTSTATEARTGTLRAFLSNNFQSPRFFIREFEKIEAVHELLTRYSIVSRQLDYYDAGRAYPFVYDVYNAGEKTVFSENFSLMCDFVHEFKSETSARGDRLVVLLIPAREQVLDEEWEKILDAFPEMKKKTWNRLQPLEKMRACLDQESVPYVDLYPIFKAALNAGNERMYYHTDPHLNEYGHTLVAKSVFDFLSAL